MRIRREHFIKLIESLDYAFWEDTPRGKFFRRSIDQHIIFVPDKRLIPCAHVASALRQSHFPENDVRDFIESHKCS